MLKATISLPEKPEDQLEILKIVFVFFLKKKLNLTHLVLYPCFVVNYKSIELWDEQLKLTIPDCLSFCDYSGVFFDEKEVNGVFIEEYAPIVNEHSLKSGSVKSDSVIGKWVLNEVKERKLKIARSGNNKLKTNDHLLIPGHSIYEKEGSFVTFDNSIQKSRLLPEIENAGLPIVLHWCKLEWSYEETSPEELTLDFTITSDKILKPESMTAYIICPDGYELKDQENSVSKTRENDDPAENRTIEFMRRFDHRDLSKKFFKEWVRAGIRHSSQFRIKSLSIVDLNSFLKDGIQKVSFFFNLSNNRWKERKQLQFVIYTVILSFVVTFVHPLDKGQICGIVIPKLITNTVMFGNLVLAGYYFLYSFNNWKMWIGILVSFITLFFFCFKDTFQWVNMPLFQSILLSVTMFYILASWYTASFGKEGILRQYFREFKYNVESIKKMFSR